MASLVDRFCPNVHDAPITAAAYDPWSGTVATADATGLVAVQRQGESAPGLMLQVEDAVNGALAIIRGGSHVLVGDESGTVSLFGTASGECEWQDAREGARGRVRAMRGVAINAECSAVAAIAKDGLLRHWDLVRGERNAWRGFSGSSVEFDPRGERLLTLQEDGQVQLFDMMQLQAIALDRLQTPAGYARFTLDGTMVVAAGQAGISLLRVADGALIGSFATRGGSGIINLVLSPDGTAAAAITQRSAHLFSLPDLQPQASHKHGAPDSSGAAAWAPEGLRVGGSDGLLHSGGSGSAGPVAVAGGFGRFRLAAHNERIAAWDGDRRVIEFAATTTPKEVHVDRDGRLVVTVPSRGPVEVFNFSSGRRVFDGGPQTSGALDVAVGGTVVAVQLAAGGCRWWDLANNSGFELKWPQAMALSHGGTWLGVLTPRGAVKILDPATGRDALPAPIPLAEVPLKRLAFVNKRPDLLVLDSEGVLGHYDLSTAAKSGERPTGRDVLTINAEVDRIWGISGGQYCALRLPEGDRSCILWIDIHAGDVAAEVPDLHPDAWVDADKGLILEPARASAVLEREMSGEERRVLRALPDGQWVSFGWNGIFDNSEGAAGAM
jgi:hypothetical protein